MNNRLSDNLIDFSNMLMLAHDKGEIIQLASRLNDLIYKAIEKENNGSLTLPQEKTISAEIKFFKEEINMMPKAFKKEFIATGCIAHVIKRQNSENSYLYEIRYQRNGYNISISNSNLSTAKKLFIEKTKHI